MKAHRDPVDSVNGPLHVYHLIEIKSNESNCLRKIKDQLLNILKSNLIQQVNDCYLLSIEE